MAVRHFSSSPIGYPESNGRVRPEAKLEETGETQISLSDPDSRSMITRGSGIVGYNVQTAVNTPHRLVVEHEVTNNGSDRDQLSGMAKKARTAIGTPTMTAIADCGYFKGEEILDCHKAGITSLVAKTKTSNAKANGRYDKADFIYDRQKDEYRCPAGQSLIYRFTTVENGMKNHRYWSSNCKDCALKERCTPSQNRRVTRWEHQDVLDAMQARLDECPNAMRIRRSSAEHPYDTIKAWMGATHFLTKGLERLKAEMSLHVLAYNFRRFLALLSTERMIDAIRAYARFFAPICRALGHDVGDSVEKDSAYLQQPACATARSSVSLGRLVGTTFRGFGFFQSLGQKRT